MPRREFAVHRITGDDLDPFIEPGLGHPTPGEGGYEGEFDNGSREQGVGLDGRDRPRPGSAADVE